MAVPSFLQVYIPSYDISKLDAKSPSVIREIITEVLNQGDDKAIKWVFENYPLDKIRECVKKPQKGVWFPESLNYWQHVLKIGAIAGQKDAILDIYPI